MLLSFRLELVVLQYVSNAPMCIAVEGQFVEQDLGLEAISMASNEAAMSAVIGSEFDTPSQLRARHVPK